MPLGLLVVPGILVSVSLGDACSNDVFCLASHSVVGVARTVVALLLSRIRRRLLFPPRPAAAAFLSNGIFCPAIYRRVDRVSKDTPPHPFLDRSSEPDLSTTEATLTLRITRHCETLYWVVPTRSFPVCPPSLPRTCNVKLWKSASVVMVVSSILRKPALIRWGKLALNRNNVDPNSRFNRRGVLWVQGECVLSWWQSSRQALSAMRRIILS